MKGYFFTFGIFWVLLVLLAGPLPLLAGENPANPAAPFQWSKHAEFFGHLVPEVPDVQFSAPVFQRATAKSSTGKKSPTTAVLLSLVLPGAGEFYAKSWIRGALMLAIEGAAWYSYVTHKKKGEDWERKYIEYADRYWSREKWEQWWNSLSPEDQEIYAHHELPDKKTQQYYEMIGKYQKFNAGWEDVNWIPGLVETDTSKRSLFYMELRANSNSELKLASYATAVVLLNHILSAFDAALAVRSFNSRVKPKVRVKYVEIDHRPAVMGSLQFSF